MNSRICCQDCPRRPPARRPTLARGGRRARPPTPRGWPGLRGDPLRAGRARGPAAELARFGLTEREREVLVRLAADRSNPEIARELFISAKTASVHVSNILAKLGASGRVEAAAVAHRLGIEPP
jgi:DNA-binding CsgD family transcriptional regulator